MRLLLALFASILLCGTASCQILNNEEIIRRVIDSGIMEGQMQKHIGVMGDGAAVLVTKILAGRDLRQTDIDGALAVLNISFADPNRVEVVSDREPRTALFILQCLDSSTRDGQLKKRIEETRTYLQGQYSKYKHSPPDK